MSAAGLRSGALFRPFRQIRCAGITRADRPRMPSALPSHDGRSDVRPSPAARRWRARQSSWRPPAQPAGVHSRLPASASCAPTAGSAVRPIAPPFCPVCGDPLPSWRTSAERCADCRLKRPHIAAGRTVGIYDGPLRAILQAFKYDRRRSLAAPLGRLMQLRGAAVLADADCVVPVPLHWRRRWRRGFNQALDLARHLGLPVRCVLRRGRNTRTQTDLPADARLRNVRDAFVRRLGGPRFRPSHRAGGRRQHDRGDTGGVRPRADGGRGDRSSDAYGSPSLDATACRTSALTSSLGRSPRSSTQPAIRRLRLVAGADAGQQIEVAFVAIAVGPLALDGDFRRMSSRIVRSAAGRKRWMSASHARSSPCASP